jgi:hypothetical protein
VSQEPAPQAEALILREKIDLLELPLVCRVITAIPLHEPDELTILALYDKTNPIRIVSPEGVAPLPFPDSVARAAHEEWRVGRVPGDDVQSRETRNICRGGFPNAQRV